MIIYKGKNKTMKIIFQLCVLEYKHKDGRVTETKGFFHDIIRRAAHWIEEGQQLSIRPCDESDLYETSAVSHEVNNAILVIQSNREYAEKLDGFYNAIFKNVDRMKSMNDFQIFWEIRKRWSNIKYIGSDEYGYFNGWVREPEFINLLALELIERFRNEHGGEDLGADEPELENRYLSDNLHRS